MSEEYAYKLIVIGDSGVGKSNIAFRFCDDMFFADSVPTLGIDFKYTRCTTLPADLVERSTAALKGPDANTASAVADHDAAPQPSVRLQIWDTAGHDRFATLTSAFYRSCQGILLCFDLTNRSSFCHIDTWLGRVKEQVGENVPPLLLVGCKADLVGGPAPSTLVSRSDDPAKPKTPRRTSSFSSSVKRSEGLVSPNPDGIPGRSGLLLRGENYSCRQVDAGEGLEWARANGAVCYLETSAKDNINVEFAFQLLATMVVRQTSGAQPAAVAPGQPSGVPMKPKDGRRRGDSQSSTGESTGRCTC